jgi:hypothetical protein
MAKELRCDFDAVTAAVTDLLKAQRKEILEHVERRFRLLEVKAGSHSEETRAVNLHRRLTAAESAIRRLTRDRDHR